MSDQTSDQTSDRPTPARKVPITFNQQTGMLDLRDIDQVYRLAQFIAAAGWAPKAYQYGKHGHPPEGKSQYDVDPNKVVLGILHGSEVSLSPMASLQSIAVINGTPTIWGDGALALVIKSGLLEDYSEVMSGETLNDIAWTCTFKRKGRATPIVGQFSMADARAAGLVGKEGPWQSYPKRMCKMRARAFALRDGFADVLRGLAVTEEVQDYKQDDDGVYRQAERREPDPQDIDVAGEVASQQAATERKPAAIEHQPEVTLQTVLGDALAAVAKADAVVRAVEPATGKPTAAASKVVDHEPIIRHAEPDAAALTTAHATYAAENYETEQERIDKEIAQQAAVAEQEDPPIETALQRQIREGGEILGPEFDTPGDPPAATSKPAASPKRELVETEELPPGVEPQAVSAALKANDLRPWLAWFKAELPRLEVRDRPHFIARYAAQIDKVEGQRGASWVGLEKALAEAARTRTR